VMMMSPLNALQHQHTKQLPNRHAAEVVNPGCLPLSTAQQLAGTVPGSHRPHRGPQHGLQQANSATLQPGASQLLCHHPAEPVRLPLLLGACLHHPQHTGGLTRGEAPRSKQPLACSSLIGRHQQYLMQMLPAAAGHVSCLPAHHRKHPHQAL
jgi:hypothetical protein